MPGCLRRPVRNRNRRVAMRRVVADDARGIGRAAEDGHINRASVATVLIALATLSDTARFSRFSLPSLHGYLRSARAPAPRGRDRHPDKSGVRHGPDVPLTDQALPQTPPTWQARLSARVARVVAETFCVAIPTTLAYPQGYEPPHIARPGSRAAINLGVTALVEDW